ncbi:hypothetical protein RhiirA1_485631 [Rhizophagus irregularis]|uniref:Uncharacterized protein n=1 Tax=Rhizophagus irregularis TaxID=588596 RepID=A0A2N0QI00_9GLOM|nr:hypothetical protein RhiirA1_485631 [Rhizophagus irregularis]
MKLRRVNILGSFFKNSHQAGIRLTQLIKENSIHRGGMKLYCKTHWTTASESVDSIIRLEPVLEQIATNNPLRKAVLALEFQSVTLGDCFLSLI